MNDIVVIDYGVGNLLSVKRGLEHCGAKAIITSAAFEADVRRRLEDQLEGLRLQKFIQDYHFDM